jgi:hypothetical protein
MEEFLRSHRSRVEFCELLKSIYVVSPVFNLTSGPKIERFACQLKSHKILLYPARVITGCLAHPSISLARSLTVFSFSLSAFSSTQVCRRRRALAYPIHIIMQSAVHESIELLLLIRNKTSNKYNVNMAACPVASRVDRAAIAL